MEAIVMPNLIKQKNAAGKLIEFNFTAAAISSRNAYRRTVSSVNRSTVRHVVWKMA